MMLKAKKTPIHNHPVITRLLQYRNVRVKVYLRITSPSQCPSKSPSNFTIVLMVTDILMDKMGCKMVKKIKGATRKNVDVDGTCKRDPSCKRETWFITATKPIPKKNQVTCGKVYFPTVFYINSLFSRLREF